MVLQVAGRWAVRAVLEITLAVALLFVVVASGPPRAWAVIVCFVVLPILALTRKMLVLDPSMRVARGAWLLRWFAGAPVSFDELRPHIHVTHEVTNYRDRNTGLTRSSRHNRRILHLTAASRASFAQSTSEFSGFDRFAIIVHSFVGAPVDAARLAAAFSAERVRVVSRAVITTLLTAFLFLMTLVFAYGSGAVAAVLGVLALPFLALSVGRWLAVADAAHLRAPDARRVSPLPNFAAHGALVGLALVAFPVVLLVRGAQRDSSSAAAREQREQNVATSAKDLAAHPAKGAVAPIVTRPAQVNTLLNVSSVLARLSAKGFRANEKSSLGSSPYTWRIEAQAGGAASGVVEVSLRSGKSLKVSGKLLGATWVSVYTQAGDTDIAASERARTAVLAYLSSRGTDDANLKDALVSVGVANVTARSGKAWGWSGPKRQEVTIDVIPMEQRSEQVARACSVSTSMGLLCAELNRAIYTKADPNFAAYALAVAANTAP